MAESVVILCHVQHFQINLDTAFRAAAHCVMGCLRLVVPILWFIPVERVIGAELSPLQPHARRSSVDYPNTYYLLELNG